MSDQPKDPISELTPTITTMGGQTMPVLGSAAELLRLVGMRVEPPVNMLDRPGTILSKQPQDLFDSSRTSSQGNEFPSGGTLKDLYKNKREVWAQKMQTAENSDVAKIYQRIILAEPGTEIAPILPLSQNEMMQFRKNKIASIIKSAVDCFDLMINQDQREIGGFIAQIMDAISQREAHISGEFYAVCDPKSLFKAVHLFGFEQSFNRMIDRGFVTPYIRKSYQEWKRQGKNKRFIAECAARHQVTGDPLAALEAEVAKAVGNLSDSMKGLAELVGPNSTIGKMFPVIASEQMQNGIGEQADKTLEGHSKTESKQAVPARYSIENLRQIFGSNETALSIIDSVQSDDFRSLMKSGFEQTIKITRDMSFSDLLRNLEIDQNLPPAQQRQAFAAQFSKFNRSFLKHAIEQFEALTEVQKVFVSFRVLGLFGFEKRRELEQELNDGLAYTQDEMSQKNSQPIEALDVQTKINFCKAVHLYELDGIYDEEVKRGRVPKPLRDFYKNWSKGKSGREYIIACKTRFSNNADAGSPAFEIDSRAVDADTRFDEIRGARTEVQPLGADAGFDEIWHAQRRPIRT
jgi:hypothetical protein